MRMREINIRNKEFIDLLNKLEVTITDWVENRSDKLMELFHIHQNQQCPEARERDDKVRMDHPGGASELYAAHDLYPPCGREMLDLMIEKTKQHGPHSELTNGFPSRENLVAYRSIESQTWYDETKEPLEAAIKDISYKYLGGGSLALAAFYPPGGYIGWHHNGNAPGYNILLHYNFGGTGNFYTFDNNEIIAYPDKPNEWVCRAGDFVIAHNDSRIDELKQRGHRDFGSSMKGVLPRVAEDVEGMSWHSAENPDTWRFTLSTVINDFDIREDLLDEIETP